MNKNRQGFTLAETILTIGIIGVIAAMVIPLVATSIQKHMLEVQLVSAYSRLDKALEVSQMENGGIEEWSDITHSSLKDNSIMLTLINKYISPYTGGDVMNNLTLRDLGYKTSVKLPNGTDYIPLDDSYYTLRLPSGQLVTFNSNGVVYTVDNVKYPIQYALTMVVDINGPTGPNVVGKDVFKFAIHRGEKTLYMLGELYFDTSVIKKKEDVFRYSSSEEIPPYIKQTREQILSNCKKNTASYCGALIKQNGWRFPKDYPWM